MNHWFLNRYSKKPYVNDIAQRPSRRLCQRYPKEKSPKSILTPLLIIVLLEGIQ